MSPLMQTLFEELREYYLDHYIDGFQRDTYTAELQHLHNMLSAALPKPCQELLRQYTLLMRAYFLMENEAMFQAAFAAARELS